MTGQNRTVRDVEGSAADQLEQGVVLMVVSVLALLAYLARTIVVQESRLSHLGGIAAGGAAFAFHLREWRRFRVVVLNTPLKGKGVMLREFPRTCVRRYLGTWCLLAVATMWALFVVVTWTS